MAHLLLCTVQAHKFWSNRSGVHAKEREGRRKARRQKISNLHIYNQRYYFVCCIQNIRYHTYRTMIMYQTHIHIIKNIQYISVMFNHALKPQEVLENFATM